MATAQCCRRTLIQNAKSFQTIDEHFMTSLDSFFEHLYLGVGIKAVLSRSLVRASNITLIIHGLFSRCNFGFEILSFVDIFLSFWPAGFGRFIHTSLLWKIAIPSS
jgi:hypothetical protein